MRINGITGDRVIVTGTYRNEFGKKIRLDAGEAFPACPREGKSVEWEMVEDESRPL
ncbi:hypothetical protein HNQ80_002055 [Anaerosolibacter carboniphilus]|uniref:Uncharacterized protein n=1 Tax=Anaerosolibacter carboniphilus TaxID=1417629 RepID=A0A841KQD5_9FIRM|nr:hypothetical protein [Anaerosolibacter carboniphilus]MBB6215964.1 hypothetical protein [Anaerosolibacter carboniphilus]